MSAVCHWVRGPVWLGAVVALLALAAVWRTHFRLTLVMGESMQPTYHTGDLLLVNRQAYRDAKPQHGDIVVARRKNEWVVKRIVGLPGEHIEIKNGRLWIGGRAEMEDYELEPGRLSIGAGRLGPGRFAILGDNRSLPPSQLLHGIVSEEEILGKVTLSIRWWRFPIS